MLKSYASKMIGVKLMLGLAYFVLSSVVALVIGYNDVAFRLLALILLNQFLHFFIQYLRSNISGLQMFKTDSFLSVFDRFILIAICSLLLWGNVLTESFRIEYLLYAQTIAYTSSIMVAVLVLFKEVGGIRIRINWVYSLSILRKTAPFALLSLLMVIYYRMDSVMLERLLPDGKWQAGVYAQSFRLLDTFSMFPFLFASLLLPMFSRMIAQKESVNSLAKFSFSLVLIPVISLVVPAVLFSEEIIQLLYHDVDAMSPKVFKALMLALLAVSGSYIFGTLLTADGQLKALNRWAGITVALNGTLNLVFIFKYGALGCAVASMLTQIFIFAVQFVIAARRFKFSIDYSLLGKFVVLVMFIIASSLALKLYTQFSILHIGLIPVIGLAYLFYLVYFA
jgi:O-antigen/teichoic acid export membrane protein